MNKHVSKPLSVASWGLNTNLLYLVFICKISELSLASITLHSYLFDRILANSFLEIKYKSSWSSILLELNYVLTS